MKALAGFIFGGKKQMSTLTMVATLDEAREATGEIRASGTDMMDRRRHHISSGNIVDISRIPGLNTIEANDRGGYSIGAHVTIDATSRHQAIISHYPGLAMAAGALATPQIRWMASMGGALLQTTRCWYFRHEAFHCYKKGGNHCPARAGDHRFGVAFDLGPCAFPHPSTIGMVLLNYGAQVEIDNRRNLSIADLYGDGRDPRRDHTLPAGEVLTRIVLPPPLADERASYFRAISRARAEWPLVEASVRLVIDPGDIITFARVAIGGVAAIPLRLPHVEAMLEGKPVSDALFARAAEAASEGATPLPMTQYKVQLIAGAVLETLQRAYRRIWGGE